MKQAGILCLGLAVFIVACGSGSTATRTPTATATITPAPALAGTLTAIAAPETATAAPSATPTPDPRPPFTISAPIAQAEAFTPDRLRLYTYFVVDAVGGAVRAIDVDWARLPENPKRGGKSFNVGWLGEDTLAIETSAQVYLAGLDGGLSLSDEPMATPTPLPLEGGEPAVSADRAWQVSGERAGFVVGQTGAPPSFRIANAYLPRWAPVGHLLAFNGNFCMRMTLFVFDPGTGKLRELAPPLEGNTLEFVWKQDASAIAVLTLGRGNPNQRAIDVVDVVSGAYSALVEGVGEVIPVAWNPGGTRLLFMARSGGRGFCDDGGVPTPRPTRLERLR